MEAVNLEDRNEKKNSKSHYNLNGKRIWVAGHSGLVGSTLTKALSRRDCEVLTVGREVIDLRRQSNVEKWVFEHKPDLIFVAAATVGGIWANDNLPADFIFDNLAISINIINSAHLAKVEKLVYLGSSCIYPLADIPIQEETLMTGPVEPTNEWYAIAKIAGIKLCAAYRRQHGCDFISAMPNNMFGPGDNFDLQGGHVIPSLIRRMHIAKTNRAENVVIWGTGSPRREFLFSEDGADAILFITENYSEERQINIGSGEEISIKNLAETIQRVVGFEGKLVFDTSKPDGASRKLLDTTRLHNLGWRPKTGLVDGIETTYRWMKTKAKNL